MPRHGSVHEDQDDHARNNNGEDGDHSSSYHFIREAQEFDSQQAWDFIYRRYQTRALLYAELQLGPELRKHLSAEDLIQEVWLRLVKSMDQFVYRGKDSFFAWFCLNIRRVAATWGRKGRPNIVEAIGEDRGANTLFESIGAEQPGPRTLIGGKDVVSMLRETLEDIPELYRDVLIEVFIEGRSRAEVAAARDKKPETLRKQLNRGLEKWRESLGGMDPTEYL